jgi:hypothetical protein
MSIASPKIPWPLAPGTLAPGTPYFSKVAELVDIARGLKPFPICVVALKGSGVFDKVGCTKGATKGAGHQNLRVCIR